MSSLGTNARPVPVMPPPPRGTGFTCFQTTRGREVHGGRSEFVVTGDVLLVTWETGWTGKQTRRIPRGDVREVRDEPDPTSSLSRGTRQLVIEYGSRQTLAPVRRRSAAETKWLAERLREALGNEDPKWTPAGAVRAAEGRLPRIVRPRGAASQARDRAESEPFPAPPDAATPDGAARVLPYGREHVSKVITVGTLPNGGVVVIIPPLWGDLAERTLPWAFGIVWVSVAAWLASHWFHRSAVAAVLLPVIWVLAAGGLALGLWRAIARRREPVVISVEEDQLYYDNPGSLDRRQHWARDKVKEVRLATRYARKGAVQRSVEVMLRGDESLHLCVRRGDEDRLRVAEVLRRAVGLEGPVPVYDPRAASARARRPAQ